MKVILALGIVIVLTAAVAGAAGQGTRNLTGPSEMVLEDLRFTPNRLDAKAGETLVVRLSNQGSVRHDLNFASLHMPDLKGVDAIMAPGESRTLSLRFDEPGTHTFRCSAPGHAAAGMTGAVFVRP